MEFVMDNELKLAKVWCSHADQRDEAKQQKLKEFIADCRKRKSSSAFMNLATAAFWKTPKSCLPTILITRHRVQRLQNRATRGKFGAAALPRTQLLTFLNITFHLTASQRVKNREHLRGFTLSNVPYKFIYNTRKMRGAYPQYPRARSRILPLTSPNCPLRYQVCSRQFLLPLAFNAELRCGFYCQRLRNHIIGFVDI